MIKYLPDSHALSVASPSGLQRSPTLSDKEFRFVIDEFQPYTEIVASALIIGKTEPNLIVKSPRQPIRIRRKGIITLLVKNRAKSLLALLLAYLMAGLIVIYNLSKKYSLPS